jgi:hypothetical protein
LNRTRKGIKAVVVSQAATVNGQVRELVKQLVRQAFLNDFVVAGFGVPLDHRSTDNQPVLVQNWLQGRNDAALLLHIGPNGLNGARVLSLQVRLQEALQHALTKLVLQEDQVDLLALCSGC